MKPADRFEKMNNDYEVHKQKYRCNHPNTELRKRTKKNKAIAYVMQCLTCGKAIPREFSKDTALINNNNIEPKAFDEELKANWENSRNKEAALILGNDKDERDLRRSEFWQWYDNYLSTPLWQKKRSLVFERAKGKCEGCRTNPAEKVHHLTYKHKGDEFLFELVAVCNECHDRLHAEHVNKSINELELT